MKESQKERETYTSNFWEALAKEVYEVFAIRVWFVEIKGYRWSFIGGIDKDPPFLPLDKIQISEKYGFVTEHWNALPQEKQKAIIEYILGKINSLWNK